MKVFLARFHGHYLPAETLVIDETKRKAFNKAKKKIEEEGLIEYNNNFSLDDLMEVNINKPNLILIDNGDY